MPANLPPQYFEAEKRYRQAETPEEKIEALEEMLAIMPKHKGTDKLRAELRNKIAKFTKEAQKRPSVARKGGIYTVKKEGAGQVVLIGLPNVGKSQLLSALTEALPEIADYPFTTKSPQLGMMKFENIQVQLVDMPPIIDQDAHPWFATVLRSADALLLLADLSNEPIKQIEEVFEELQKRRIKPIGKEAKAEPEQWVFPKRTIILGNKSDLDPSGKKFASLKEKYGGQFPVLPASAKTQLGLEELKREIFEALNIVRVYTKVPGGKPDLNDPMILKKGSTVADAAEEIHKDFRHKLKYAQIWGSGKFAGQRVKRDHVLQDGDIIELHA